MESNNKLKETDLKNRICHYFDNIIKFKDFDFNNILIDENFIYSSIRYLIGVKNVITYVISHNYVKVRVDS